MMLEEFTWQQFLVAAMVLSLIWFVVFGLLYWRGSLSEKRLGGTGAGGDDFEPLPHGWQDKVDELADDGLMGKPALEHGVSVLEADEFSFVPREAEAMEPDPLGELADVQEEIKGICRILEKEDGNKEDFFSLFSLVRSKYPRVAGSALLGEINDFIREQVPFFLSEEELETLWV